MSASIPSCSLFPVRIDVVSHPNHAGTHTRWRTRHILRPAQAVVEEFLDDLTDEAWERFQTAYIAVLNERLSADRSAFERLAELAQDSDVFLGCSCPTKKNPDVRHCHTYLALGFMQEHFPEVEVAWP